MYNTQDGTWGNITPIATPTKPKKKNRKSLIFSLILLGAGSSIYYQYNKEEIIPTTPMPERKPDPIPSGGLDYDYTPTAEIEDSVMVSEKRLITNRQSQIKGDTLYINASYLDTEKNGNLPKIKKIKISKNDLEKLKKNLKYKDTHTMDDDGRQGYMKHIQSSLPILKKIVSGLGIDKIKDRDEKIKSISLFIQSRDLHNQMGYKHDLVNTRKGIDTVDYIRPPAISIIDGLKSGEQGDCDDFASNFIALSIAASIPETDIYMIYSHTHAFVGVKGYKSKVEGPNYYFGPRGEKIIPIENTANSEEIIRYNYLTGSMKTDTLTTRSHTIGGVDNSDASEVKIRNIDYPNGFIAKRRKK